MRTRSRTKEADLSNDQKTMETKIQETTDTGRREPEKTRSVPEENSKLEEEKRTLFVKNLPNGITSAILQAISKKIVSVRLRALHRQKRDGYQHRMYAYLVFETERDADHHLKTLKTVNGSSVMVDYVGEKSKNKTAKSSAGEQRVDPKRIYVTGFTPGNARNELSLLYPRAVEIDIPSPGRLKHPIGYAFVRFKTVADASAALVKDRQLNGHTIIALPAKTRKRLSKDNDEDEAVTKKVKLTDAIDEVGEEPSDEEFSDFADDDNENS